MSPEKSMSRMTRTINLVAVFGPFVALAVAIPLLWGDLVGWSDVVAFAVMYLVAGFGVTVGYHRLLTHRAFATHKPVEYTLAIMGSLAVQGSPIEWVADHRKHHAHTDVEGDPHSPHVGNGSGISGALRGLWHSHVGWLFETQGLASARKYAKEVVEDPRMRTISRAFPLLALLTLALPALIGYALTGTARGALTGFVWGGLVRVVIQHHITWSVNSVCHFFGSRRFALDDHSTNVFWLALPSLGEAWHHNHHAFARSAYHGLSRREALLDPSGWVIRLMRRVGLAWNVVAITPERQGEKLAKPAEPADIAA
ncbi:MAG TPA: fatty acid desaturase [Solirubrobacteraceae bacterium]|nr:fatty acid desaturase [Solirubrobacteraceae bacterium]